MFCRHTRDIPEVFVNEPAYVACMFLCVDMNNVCTNGGDVGLYVCIHDVMSDCG